jgi:hypothetical protein
MPRPAPVEMAVVAVAEAAAMAAAEVVVVCWAMVNVAKQAMGARTVLLAPEVEMGYDRVGLATEGMAEGVAAAQEAAGGVREEGASAATRGR